MRQHSPLSRAEGTSSPPCNPRPRLTLWRRLQAPAAEWAPLELELKLEPLASLLWWPRQVPRRLAAARALAAAAAAAAAACAQLRHRQAERAASPDLARACGLQLH
jgi:hypothetical protein